jgi:hypothetical protein
MELWILYSEIEFINNYQNLFNYQSPNNTQQQMKNSSSISNGTKGTWDTEDDIDVDMSVEAEDKVCDFSGDVIPKGDIFIRFQLGSRALCIKKEYHEQLEDTFSMRNDSTVGENFQVTLTYLNKICYMCSQEEYTRVRITDDKDEESYHICSSCSSRISDKIKMVESVKKNIVHRFNSITIKKVDDDKPAKVDIPSFEYNEDIDYCVLIGYKNDISIKLNDIEEIRTGIVSPDNSNILNEKLGAGFDCSSCHKTLDESDYKISFTSNGRHNICGDCIDDIKTDLDRFINSEKEFIISNII